MAAFGITQCRLQSALSWFTVRKLFVLNCAFLGLNVLFYLTNNGLIPSCSKVRFMPPLNSSTEVRFMPPLNSSTEVRFMPPLNSSTEVRFMPPFNSSTEVRFMPPLNSSTEVHFMPSRNSSTEVHFMPSRNSSIEAYFMPPFNPSTEVYFTPALDSELRAILDMTFQALTEAMESSNVTYFVFAGTLLGSWRHHDLIPWDDDIDVIFNVSDLQTVSRVLRSKVAEDPKSFGLYERPMSSEGLVEPWKFYSQNGQNPSHDDFKTPNIDVFFYRENETHIWNTSPYFFTTEIWLKSHVFPVRRRLFGNFMVPAPCNPEAFLEVTINVSLCETRPFDHVLDTGMPFEPINVPCSRLAHLYPFVHRTNISNEGSEKFVLETLSLGNSTLGRFKARTSC